MMVKMSVVFFLLLFLSWVLFFLLRISVVFSFSGAGFCVYVADVAYAKKKKNQERPIWW